MDSWLGCRCWCLCQEASNILNKVLGIPCLLPGLEAPSTAEAALLLHALKLWETYIWKWKIRHAGKNPTPRLTTGRVWRFLTYRKPGPDQAGHGLGSALCPPLRQPRTSFGGLVSLSQPSPQPSFPLCPGLPDKRQVASSSRLLW